MKEEGLWQHPMSGAGRIKFDGSSSTQLVEWKTTGSKSYSVTFQLIQEIWREALRQSKSPVLVIEFLDEGGEVVRRLTCHIS